MFFLVEHQKKNKLQQLLTQGLTSFVEEQKKENRNEIILLSVGEIHN